MTDVIINPMSTTSESLCGQDPVSEDTSETSQNGAATDSTSSSTTPLLTNGGSAPPSVSASETETVDLMDIADEQQPPPQTLTNGALDTADGEENLRANDEKLATQVLVEGAVEQQQQNETLEMSENVDSATQKQVCNGKKRTLEDLEDIAINGESGTIDGEIDQAGRGTNLSKRRRTITETSEGSKDSNHDSLNKNDENLQPPLEEEEDMDSKTITRTKERLSPNKEIISREEELDEPIKLNGNTIDENDQENSTEGPKSLTPVNVPVVESPLDPATPQLNEDSAMTTHCSEVLPTDQPKSKGDASENVVEIDDEKHESEVVGGENFTTGTVETLAADGDEIGESELKLELDDEDKLLEEDDGDKLTEEKDYEKVAIEKDPGVSQEAEGDDSLILIEEGEENLDKDPLEVPKHEKETILDLETTTDSPLFLQISSESESQDDNLREQLRENLTSDDTKERKIEGEPATEENIENSQQIKENSEKKEIGELVVENRVDILKEFKENDKESPEIKENELETNSVTAKTIELTDDLSECDDVPSKTDVSEDAALKTVIFNEEQKTGTETLENPTVAENFDSDVVPSVNADPIDSIVNAGVAENVPQIEVDEPALIAVPDAEESKASSSEPSDIRAENSELSTTATATSSFLPTEIEMMDLDELPQTNTNIETETIPSALSPQLDTPKISPEPEIINTPPLSPQPTASKTLTALSNIKSSLKGFKREDLEALIMEKMVETLLFKSSAAENAQKIRAQDEQISKLRQKLAECKRQFESVQLIFKSTTEEVRSHEANGCKVTPRPVLRTVGIQSQSIHNFFCKKCGTKSVALTNLLGNNETLRSSAQIHTESLHGKLKQLSPRISVPPSTNVTTKTAQVSPAPGKLSDTAPVVKPPPVVNRVAPQTKAPKPAKSSVKNAPIQTQPQAQPQATPVPTPVDNSQMFVDLTEDDDVIQAAPDTSKTVAPSTRSTTVSMPRNLSIQVIPKTTNPPPLTVYKPTGQPTSGNPLRTSLPAPVPSQPLGKRGKLENNFN